MILDFFLRKGSELISQSCDIVCNSEHRTHPEP